MRTLANAPFVASVRYAQQHQRANRERCDPLILEFERAFVLEFAKYQIPMFTHCVFRGAREQDRLLKAGNSRARWGQSPHNFGLAADIIHGVRAWQLTPAEWRVIGAIGKEVARKRNIAIEWGGDWKFYDPAHWELVDWRVRSKNH